MCVPDVALRDKWATERVFISIFKRGNIFRYNDISILDIDSFKINNTSNCSWVNVCGNNHHWINTHGFKSSVEIDCLIVEQIQCGRVTTARRRN